MKIGDCVIFTGTLVGVHSTPEFDQIEVEFEPGHRVFVKSKYAETNPIPELRQKLDRSIKGNDQLSANLSKSEKQLKELQKSYNVLKDKGAKIMSSTDPTTAPTTPAVTENPTPATVNDPNAGNVQTTSDSPDSGGGE